jgi:hypothetical protein
MKGGNKMHTLFDFVTHIKTVEYILAVFFIAGFIVYWEIFKPKPFRSLVNSCKEDMSYVRETGLLKTTGKIVGAPFIGLAYIIAIPILFYFTLLSLVITGFLRLFGVSASFGWNPVEAYLSGKKGKDSKK